MARTPVTIGILQVRYVLADANGSLTSGYRVRKCWFISISVSFRSDPFRLSVCPLIIYVDLRRSERERRLLNPGSASDPASVVREIQDIGCELSSQHRPLGIAASVAFARCPFRRSGLFRFVPFWTACHVSQVSVSG